VYEKVANTIQQEKLFQPDSRIVVGVSGGADSLCLLDCLSHLGYSLVVAHLDHRLRQESGT
jgi:tRNA(Ile)-lysidine synthase